MAECHYCEKIRSNTTSLLFVFLALTFFALGAWRVLAVGLRFTPLLFVSLGLFFTFYIVNYRTLEISIFDDALELKFGLVRWRTELHNIQACIIENSPLVIKYGGAGVHFAFVEGEYRAYFNFLEYPRVLLRFYKKQGLVQALVFTTRHPDQVLKILQEQRPRS
jgi:hypothetical protein